MPKVINLANRFFNIVYYNIHIYSKCKGVSIMFTKFTYCLVCTLVSVVSVVSLYSIFDCNNTVVDIAIALLGGMMVTLFAWGYHVLWGFKYFD